jgi:hypothetical protein
MGILPMRIAERITAWKDVPRTANARGSADESASWSMRGHRQIFQISTLGLFRWNSATESKPFVAPSGTSVAKSSSNERLDHSATVSAPLAGRH